MTTWATVPQCSAISGALTKHGVRTRAHRLEIVSRLAGRDLQSTKDLTRAEELDLVTVADRIYARWEIAS